MIPLAERMRPETLDEVAGQKHLAGPDGVLRNFLKSRHLPSIIFWGPPGTGKTTLAAILARESGFAMYSLSAISAGVKDVREVIAKARVAGKVVLFIDEIHRFSKSQQDSLLAAVEQGIVILIGATTENPSFEVIRPLLSRCQVYVLESLRESDLDDLIASALNTDEVLSRRKITISEKTALYGLSGGDARRLLNLLDMVVSYTSDDPVVITDALVMRIAQQRMAVYDKGGEQHYDVISAFIKSLRGSDPNAALYWMARMIEGGEDPRFIARRMVILASEDIGNANPNALLLAVAAFQAVEVIGAPECFVNLAHLATYLASSPKSNASYMALRQAQAVARDTGSASVPLPLRNAVTGLMKHLDYGKGYRYAHDFEQSFIAMEFMPEVLNGYTLYTPGDTPREQELRKFLKERWKDKYGY